MPAILIIFLVCMGLFLLFPKGFKFMVGTFVGVMGGGFFWCLFSLAFTVLFTPVAFIAFIIVGIIIGNVFAAVG